MNASGYLVLAVLVVTAVYFGIRWLARSRYGGTRPVTCPETGNRALVEVDALHASLTSTVGLPDIRLEHCSRWPLNEQCGQECLVDLDVAPGQCLVSGVLMRWYRDKNCVYCGKRLSELHWLDHRPALLGTEGKLLSWNAVTADKLETVLATHSAVCRNCDRAQGNRVDHPAAVIYRPRLNDNSGGADGLSAPRRDR